MKRITIIASGTRGDIQPAITPGKALQANGYQVKILASPNFRGWIEEHGLEAVPRHKLTAVNLTHAIQQTVTDEQIKQNAAALGAKIRAEDGLGNAVKIINQTLGHDD